MVILWDSYEIQGYNISIYQIYPPVMANSLLWEKSLELIGKSSNQIVFFHTYAKLTQRYRVYSPN